MQVVASLQVSQCVMQARQLLPLRWYPVAQVRQVAYAVQVLQERGHAEQEAPDLKYPSWQVLQIVGPRQFAQGSEQAVHEGEAR